MAIQPTTLFAIGFILLVPMVIVLLPQTLARHPIVWLFFIVGIILMGYAVSQIKIE